MEIRARVQGFLQSREFQPGQFVKKDQVLFKIEPEQFEAAVTAAEGNLAKAKADFEIARGDRIAQLVVARVLRPEWVEVAVLDETDRGEGGFGHTGQA